MKYEITSKKEFQIEAAKALLADGQPHSYAEIVQHIRSQAEGTVLEGRIDYGNVWYSLRSMMEEPGSHYPVDQAGHRPVPDRLPAIHNFGGGPYGVQRPRPAGSGPHALRQ